MIKMVFDQHKLKNLFFQTFRLEVQMHPRKSAESE